MPQSESTFYIDPFDIMSKRKICFRSEGEAMKRRVFTRRRHAETTALRRLRFCALIGLPAALCVIAWELTARGGMPTAGASAFVIAALAYTAYVFKVHDLTGEWRFF